MPIRFLGLGSRSKNWTSGCFLLWKQAWGERGRGRQEKDRPYGCTTNKNSELALGQSLGFHTGWAYETDRKESMAARRRSWAEARR